ncbi:unnamed protein product [Symbiodinium sp. KB8]|nr:unnamed protein product [Symbiodinium sp. KB8]
MDSAAPESSLALVTLVPDRSSDPAAASTAAIFRTFTSMAAKAGAEKLCGTAKWATHASGFPHDLSDEQREELDKFMTAATTETLEAVKFPHETNEDVACRFMRARKFGVEDALTMINNCKISTSCADSCSVPWRGCV